jgi:hypothetical protein
MWQIANITMLFEQANKMYSVDKRLSQHVSKRARSNSEGVLESISQETVAIGSELQRYQAYSEVMAAVGRIHSTLGIGIIPAGTTATTLDDISAAVDHAMADWRSGAAINKEVQVLNQMPTEAPTPVAKPEPEPKAEIAAVEKTKPQVEVKKTAIRVLKPVYVDFNLNEGPGEAPIMKAALDCKSIETGSTENGWVEVSGTNAKGLNMNGWVHNIYLTQGMLQCKNLVAAGS